MEVQRCNSLTTSGVHHLDVFAQGARSLLPEGSGGHRSWVGGVAKVARGSVPPSGSVDVP